MTRKEKKKNAMAEDKFMNSLPQPFKAVFGFLRYNFKEILIIIILVLLGYILAFNLWCVGGHIEYKPQNLKDIRGS